MLYSTTRRLILCIESNLHLHNYILLGHISNSIYKDISDVYFVYDFLYLLTIINVLNVIYTNDVNIVMLLYRRFLW
jgi:hypothetical protein